MYTPIKQIRKTKQNTTCKMVTQNIGLFCRVKQSRSTILKTIFPTNLTLKNKNENKYNNTKNP